MPLWRSGWPRRSGKRGPRLFLSSPNLRATRRLRSKIDTTWLYIFWGIVVALIVLGLVVYFTGSKAEIVSSRRLRSCRSRPKLQ